MPPLENKIPDFYFIPIRKPDVWRESGNFAGELLTEK